MGWNDREPAASWIEQRQAELMCEGLSEYRAYSIACDEYIMSEM